MFYIQLALLPNTPFGKDKNLADKASNASSFLLISNVIRYTSKLIKKGDAHSLNYYWPTYLALHVFELQVGCNICFDVI